MSDSVITVPKLDTVKSVGMLALGVMAVYILYRIYKVGDSAEKSVTGTVNDIVDGVKSVVSSVGDVVAAPFHGAATGLKSISPQDSPPPEVSFGNTPVLNDPVYDPMTGVVIGLDSLNGGRFSAVPQVPSPNAFMAMTGNSDNDSTDPKYGMGEA